MFTNIDVILILIFKFAKHQTKEVIVSTALEEDLRPITLTSPLAKVMEGFTLDLLISQTLGQLDIKQFSVSHQSTMHALVYILHSIFEALDKGGNRIRMFFADFSKGFDLVDLCALLKELQVMNVHSAIIRWIGAFLTQRPQRCRIAGSLSSPVEFARGLN